MMEAVTTRDPLTKLLWSILCRPEDSGLRLMLADELEQPAAGVVVFDMRLEVLGQIVDAFRKNGHLHLRRSSVAGLGRIGLDDFRLACG